MVARSATRWTDAWRDREPHRDRMMLGPSAAAGPPTESTSASTGYCTRWIMNPGRGLSGGSVTAKTFTAICSMDLNTVRKHLEERERLLSPQAAKSYESRGREAYEEPSAVRTEFQRDRGRIVPSKAFRRLKHKTQVFIAPVGDHFVTPLTHT